MQELAGDAVIKYYVIAYAHAEAERLRRPHLRVGCAVGNSVLRLRNLLTGVCLTFIGHFGLMTVIRLNYGMPTRYLTVVKQTQK